MLFMLGWYDHQLDISESKRGSLISKLPYIVEYQKKVE